MKCNGDKSANVSLYKRCLSKPSRTRDSGDFGRKKISASFAKHFVLDNDLDGWPPLWRRRRYHNFVFVVVSVGLEDPEDNTKDCEYCLRKAKEVVDAARANWCPVQPHRFRLTFAFLFPALNPSLFKADNQMTNWFQHRKTNWRRTCAS